MFVIGRPPWDGAPAVKGIPIAGVRIGEALCQYHEFQQLINMNETGLILLSTDHCALCDEALGLLLSMPELAGISLRVVDVAEDDELVSTYGQRLPVLLCAGRELAWPFVATDVLRWLRQIEQA